MLLRCAVSPPKAQLSRQRESSPAAMVVAEGRKRIVSVSNPLVKHGVKLRLSSSYRRSNNSVLLLGLTPILEICKFQEMKNDDSSIVDCLLLLDGVEIPREFCEFPVIMRVSPAVMKKLAGVQSVDTMEAIAIMKMPKTFLDMGEKDEGSVSQSWLSTSHRVLVLEGVQDPGNLGTLLRSAMAFNWDGVFLLPGCCDPFNDKAVRAARGASFQLPIISGSWFHIEELSNSQEMKMLAGHPGSYDKGSKQPWSLSREFVDSLAGKRICLVLGSEGHGLSKQTMQACELVSIPMAGRFESLNVSVAGGIFLFMLQP